MRRGSATPVVPASGTVIIVIAARLAISQVFSVVWGLWLVCDGVRALAGVAATFLGFEEPPVGSVDRQGCLVSSPGPVFAQCRVLGGRPVSDDLVADDVGPGEAVEVGAA